MENLAAPMPVGSGDETIPEETSEKENVARQPETASCNNETAPEKALRGADTVGETDGNGIKLFDNATDSDDDEQAPRVEYYAATNRLREDEGSQQAAADKLARHHSILQRKLERDNQRKIQNRYMRLLDDRLDSLEQDVWNILGKSRYLPPPPPPLLWKPKFIEEIKSMHWVEYLEDKCAWGPPARDVQVAISTLIDEPEWFDGRPDVYIKKKQMEEAEKRPNHLRNNALKELVPERIKIHSPHLRDALLDFAPDGFSHSHLAVIVMRRPFKFLTYNEENLRRFTEEKEKEISDLEQNKDAKMTEQEEQEDSAPNNEKDDQSDASGDGVDLPSLKSTVKQLNLLLDFVAKSLTPLKTIVPKLEHISFQDLHFLFKSGQIVHVRHKDHPQKTWRLVQVTGGNRYLRPHNREEEGQADCFNEKKDKFSPFVLDCYCLAFDGTQFRRTYQWFTVPYFSDEMPMKKLWILPLEVASHNGLASEELIREKNKQYLECTRARHFNFFGRTLDKDSLGNRLKVHDSLDIATYIIPESVDGNIMVDFDKAYQLNQDWRLNTDDLPPYKINPREWENGTGYGNKETIQGDFFIDARCREMYLDQEDGKKESWENAKIEDDDIIVLPDRVPAFLLRSRKWVMIPIGTETKNGVLIHSLKAVERNDEAWNNLQLPGEDNADHRTSHKYIVQSLVDKHFAKGMDLDIVRNKGRGLIVLLHGAPGVGKTSTAECVAEAEGKPLLPITCGDLGLDPQEVERNLSRHFELAQHWECILLLDEADVFLATRSLQDLKRNALVSVFLRILEYYEGILFLTTNKVGLIDEAFKSRIHMALHYPWLDESQTIKIWKSLLRMAKRDQQLDIDEDDIIVFAKELWSQQVNSSFGKGPDGKAPGWNGRQIKNAFMSAIALAQYEAKNKKPSGNTETPTRVVLKPSHFKTVEKASEAFDSYLWKVHAYKNDSKLAEAGRYRVDGYGYSLPGLNTNPTIVQYPTPVNSYAQVAVQPQHQYAYQPGTSFQAPSVHRQPVNMGPLQPVNMAPQPPPNQGYAIRGETVPVQNQGQFQQPGYQQHVEYQQYPGQAPQQPHLRTSSEQHPQQPQGVQNIYSGNSAYGQLPVQSNPDRQPSSFQG